VVFFFRVQPVKPSTPRAPSSSYHRKSTAAEPSKHNRPVSQAAHNTTLRRPVNCGSRLRKLNEKYGPLASLKMGAGNMIVIGGDGSLVRQLLDKRAAIYSNRPLQLATEIALKGDFLL